MKHIALFEEFGYLDKWKRLKELGLIDSSDLKILEVKIIKTALLRIADKDKMAELEKTAAELGLLRITLTRKMVKGQTPVEIQRWIGPSEALLWLKGWFSDLNQYCDDGKVIAEFEDTQGQAIPASFLESIWLAAVKRGQIYWGSSL
jgi:hypothetical protein